MKKHANLLIGILIGLGAYHLYSKRKKKGCGCGGHSEEETATLVTIEDSANDSECDQAVRRVLAERKSLMRVTPEEYKKQYEEEMTICRGYMNA